MVIATPIILRKEDLQDLMDQLYRQGIRPTDESLFIRQLDGQVKAHEDHIQSLKDVIGFLMNELNRAEGYSHTFPISEQHSYSEATPDNDSTSNS